MKKIIVLSSVALCLSISAFSETIKAKGELVDFNIDNAWVNWGPGEEHLDYFNTHPPIVKFKIVEPKEYFNKTVEIYFPDGTQTSDNLGWVEFYTDELRTRKSVMSLKIGKFYTFEIHKDFLDGDHGLIWDKDIKNFKDVP